MPDVSDGVYRASFFTSSSRSYPSNGVGDEVVMQPDREAAQRWEIRNVASTDYTIRVADTDRYLGYDGNAPSPWKKSSSPRSSVAGPSTTGRNRTPSSLAWPAEPSARWVG
jgi:hypothetical protein